jgi:hypothetical protein
MEERMTIDDAIACTHPDLVEHVENDFGWLL